MEAFEPIVNLLALMAVLSVACERITEILKLRGDKDKTEDMLEEEKKTGARAYRFSLISFLLGIGVALLVKANFFEFMVNLRDPWATLGWVRLENYNWVRSPVTVDAGRFVYALIGCVVTGVGLGFGNKFWHDLLGTVNEVKNLTNQKRRVRANNAPATVQE